MEEDPTFTVQPNVGDRSNHYIRSWRVHLDVIASRLKNKFGVNAVFTEPKVPYRETIRKSIKSRGKA